MKVEFSENNSGGSWWLDRKQYDALLANGWNAPKPDEDPGFLKSFKERSEATTGVPYAWRHGLWGEFESLRAAVENFERVTGEDFFAEGCNCCGCPFSMSTRGGGEYDYISGDSIQRAPIRPW